MNTNNFIAPIRISNYSKTRSRASSNSKAEKAQVIPKCIETFVEECRIIPKRDEKTQIITKYEGELQSVPKYQAETQIIPKYSKGP